MNSAGAADDITIFRTVGLDRRTHVAYERLLLNMFVGELVPAWSTNRLKRLVRTPKRYVVDPALMAAAARIGRSDVLDDAGLLGRVIDTFVASEMRSHAAVEPSRPQMFHLRTEGGRQEIDLLLEYDGAQVFAVEVKSSATPTLKDGRHLVWLRDELGERFAGGVVFHTGPEMLDLSDRIKAMPICALWGAVA